MNTIRSGTLRRKRRTLTWLGASSVLALSITLASCAGTPTTTATEEPAASSSTSTSTTGSSSEVVALAEAFAATLSDDQKASLYQDYSLENAENWSNFPNALLAGGGPGAQSSGGGRVGLQTDSLTDEQWTALEALLSAVTGSAENEGFDEIMQHLAADDYLADNGGGSDYGTGNFFIAFLGTPSDSGTWELQFGGHHLALANTYVDGALAGATPSFRGIEPFETVEQDGTTVQAEQQEQEAFAALLASLTTEQLATAELSESFNDILLGPGNDWAFPTTSEGIKGSDLTDEQKALVLAAIATYVGDVDDADAAAILAEYESELDETYISFSGSTSMAEEGDYIRIDGPSVWIESSMQHGIVLSGAHPHSVWRDKQNDYGGTTS
ncbi:DUF3500 domain-containing protein [Microbacterium allomyrinae]|uniref:DUF3500 domain-containing protein n=1 Tax=Microbacterium allomyrinae TaxID=2830666 RepID=A0A9X1LSX4_9MICO|nr:DUF3500 domain-containing protein [Microbacterium allomyrinae]MCC2031567.1 DUF3500 domain-containing protein [Microbacterium allomyrinae]